VDGPFVSGAQLACLLALSDSRRGKYGLEISRDAKLKRGTVYTTLDRLTDRGLVRFHRPRNWDHPGMLRPIYSLTPEGERMVKAARILTG
jgi:DNA-binding PadR family transcriptional regulator